MKLASKIALLFVFVISSAKAQHDHSSHSHDDGAAHEHKAEPPHGGEIKDVGKYHFEIVFDVYTANEKLNVWVLKSNFKAVEPKDFTGKVKIQYADGKEIEKTLTVNPEKLFCNVEDITKAFTAVIMLTIKGKEYHTIYNYKGLGK
jgi:hypothetical protein